MINGIVSTIGQKCRRCYSCIRECPANAIKVMGGQAVVQPERCISCGHCVKVCSQHAKEIESDFDRVINSLLPSGRAAAIIAPSFPAAFPDEYNKIPTALRKAGFSLVTETAFGADLISGLYEELFESRGEKTIISSPCPAVYNYIEKYYSDLVPNLARIVSPMIAMGRYLKKYVDKDLKVVFIGPCVAKKSEILDEEVQGAIDAVLTFTELKELFEKTDTDPASLEDSFFDPPMANQGKSFPLAGGLLKTSGISGDILAKEVIVVEGKNNVEEIIKDIADDKIKSKFVDILFCEGCINGPGIGSDLNLYSKREKVIDYIEENILHLDKKVWMSDIYNSRDINLKREFTTKSQKRPMPSEEKIKEILARTNKHTIGDELNCGACGYHSCREYAISIAKGLAEEDMCLPYLIETLEQAYRDLKATQDQLQSAEKLASIGQLAAGVAHEINNPLGTIMLYSSMLQRALSKTACVGQNSEDLQMIIDEANRCKGIVANLLNFARQGKLKISEVSIVNILNDIVRTAGLKPENSQVNISINDESNSRKIKGDSDQLRQVLMNIINNACEACLETDKKEVNIRVSNDERNVVIEVKDTGCGIPEDNFKKLFTPFFTTKKMGKGTGLGLAISYGIIKMHRGDIKVKSVVNEGTIFTIKFPLELTLKNVMVN